MGKRPSGMPGRAATVTGKLVARRDVEAGGMLFSVGRRVVGLAVGGSHSNISKNCPLLELTVLEHPSQVVIDGRDLDAVDVYLLDLDGIWTEAFFSGLRLR